MRKRRVFVLLVALVMLTVWIVGSQAAYEPSVASEPTSASPVVVDVPAREDRELATAVLATLEVKGRAPKTGYKRTQFGNGWASVAGCDTRNRILARDMADATISDDCKVLSGTLNDPYTGKTVLFTRGADTSALVQIDHVVALSNAWQTGAQGLTLEKRIELANDPLELLAVDGDANQKKGDGDAATWLPANKSFRCQYVARQIAIKAKYQLWVVPAEKQAMLSVLAKCPEQTVPVEQ